MGATDLTASIPVPVLEGRFVRLRALVPDDLAWIHQMSTDPILGFRWRHAPGSVDPATFAAQLWTGVALQLAVVEKRAARPIGLTICYGMDQANRTAHVAGVFEPSLHKTGWVVEALPLFVRHTFAAFDLRKLYAEVVDFNLAQYATVLGRRVHREGVLREHWWIGGAYRDVHILALLRDEWAEPFDEIVREALLGARHRAQPAAL